MKFPTVEVQGRKLILLSGVSAGKTAGEMIDPDALDKLRDAFRKNPDAVAFGYTRGRWVAAA